MLKRWMYMRKWSDRMTHRALPRLWFALWIALIVTVVVPWGKFVDDTRSSTVRWARFVEPPVSAFDVVANVFFYMPYGYLYARQRHQPQHAIVAAVASAFALSVCTEATQLYSHSRFPSLTDVASNVAGAYLGARWTQRCSRGQQQKEIVTATRAPAEEHL